MNPSATRVVRLAVISGILLCAATVWLALTLPVLDVRLQVEEGRVVAEGVAGSSGPVAVTAIRSQRGEQALEPLDLLDEPDVVETWARLNEFFARQQRLAEILEGEQVELQRQDGPWLPVHVSARDPSTLHWSFYSQTLAALLAWLVGLITFAFSDRKAGARAYAISGVGIAVVMWPAAVYTTRALALDGTLFRALSALDHAGGYVFCVGVIALFAGYPTPLIRRLWWLWASAPLGFALDQLQVLPKERSDFYRTASVYLLMFIIIAAWQWLASRGEPVARAAFRWILLSTLFGMSSFVVAILLPLVLGFPRFASQGFALTCYAATYAGISIGILKLRLFELDRWWFRAWSWVLGGVLVLLGDVLLMSLFDLGTRESLLLTLAIVGWLYFPMRQWVWARLFRAEPGVDALDIAGILTARSLDELAVKLEVALRALFSPLRIESRPEPLDAARLDSMGTALLLPKPSSGHLVCHYRNGGKDLFRTHDVGEAGRLLAVVGSVARALCAHREGQEQERARIRRDLHDDLGASIIRIIHAAPDGGTAALAKRTMRDLRNVLLALSPESASVSETLDDLRGELERTVEARGQLTWQVDADADWQLSSRQRANLVRTLREATTNALRHGSGNIEYRFAVSNESLEAQIRNPAFAPVDELGTGFGIPNIAARIEELGGCVQLREHAGEFCLALQLPRRVNA